MESKGDDMSSTSLQTNIRQMPQLNIHDCQGMYGFKVLIGNVILEHYREGKALDVPNSILIPSEILPHLMLP